MFRKLEMSELGRMTPQETRNKQKFPLVLVLDSIRSLMNVGSIFRTADAFQVQKLFLCGFTGTPPHREIQKTALGATETVEWQYFENLSDCLQYLKENGFQIWAIEQTTNSTILSEMDFKEENPFAFVLGNEVSGVSDEAFPFCKGVIEIPQFGSKHSLNVAVTAGIVVWEFVKEKTRK
jgi:23S rRNA (guanosine2251-2'-O)-methyltransferase